jgi:hypothetical protein
MICPLLSSAQQEVLASQPEDSGLQPLLQSTEEPDVGQVKKRGRPASKGKANKREINLSLNMLSESS